MTNEEIKTFSEAILDSVIVEVSARPYNDEDITGDEAGMKRIAAIARDMQWPKNRVDIPDSGDVKTVVCITFSDGRILFCVDPILL